MRSVGISIFVFVVIAITGCKKSYSPPPEGSYMMFVNACDDAGNLYAVANNSTLPGTIAYNGHTRYQYVASGVDTIAFLLNNLDTLRRAEYGTTFGYYYSFFAIGSVVNPSTFVVYDDMYEPAKGTAKIRFINLSDDSLNETESLQTTMAGLEPWVIASGAKSRTASPFAQIAAPGAYTIQVTDTSRGVTLTAPTQLDSGKIYTVVLSGSSGNIGTSALSLTVITNNP